MGLISNLLVGIVHLVFVAMDVFLLMVILKVIYSQWELPWLKQIIKAIEPLMNFTLNYFERIVVGITGRRYSEKTLWLLVILCLLLVRLMCGLSLV